MYEVDSEVFIYPYAVARIDRRKCRCGAASLSGYGVGELAHGRAAHAGLAHIVARGGDGEPELADGNAALPKARRRAECGRGRELPTPGAANSSASDEEQLTCVLTSFS